MEDSTKTVAVALWLSAVAAGVLAGEPTVMPEAAAPPQKLSETGLYVAGTSEIAPDIMSYSPQYPLWSDGAEKRRWLYLPPGTSIDAADADAWKFPPGTRLWKEFRHERAVETRMIERLADGSWRYATYVWKQDGSDAELAPADGWAALPAEGAPGGTYAVPTQNDCRSCHEASPEPVLGVSALQLSPDRDALAPHGERADATYVDLRVLHERGVLRNLSPELLATPPRIEAPSPQARAVLGYLHGNCGHCHNEDGPLAELNLTLRQSVAADTGSEHRTLRTLVGYPTETSTRTIDTRIVPGSLETSMLYARMRTRNPLMQMPPLGTSVSDAAALSLIGSWIENDVQPEEELEDEQPE